MKQLSKYLLITFGITWVCWWGDALLVKLTTFSESDPLPMVLFIVGGFGPTVAAFLCLEGGFSKKNLRFFFSNNRKKSWLFLLGALALETVVFLLSSHGLNETIPRSPAGMIAVLIVFLSATVFFGGNEELGWRGIMQPILQKKLPSPIATLITGVVWVSWHIPLWFIEGNSHQNTSFLSFALLGIALSYWLSAVYNVTFGVLFCMILHGWTNTLMGILTMKETMVYYIGISMLTLISIIVSVAAVKRNRLRSDA